MGSLSLKNLYSYSVSLVGAGLDGIYIVQPDLINGKKWYKGTGAVSDFFITWSKPSVPYPLGAWIVAAFTPVYVAEGNATFPWQQNWNTPAGGYISLSPININNNKISIKKQNLISLKSVIFYSEDQATYIFRSATNNTLSNIFNYLEFEAYNDTLEIFYEGSLDGSNKVVLSNGSKWIDMFNNDSNNYIIPANSIIRINLSLNKNILIGGGAVIQKYYGGKINLREFIPKDLPGLQLWLDATVGLYDLAGEPVFNYYQIAKWEDQSGNGRHATQSNPDYMALLQTGSQNKKNGIYFDGENDFYTGIANAIGTFTANSKFTFFIVCKPDLSGRQASYGGGGIIGKRQYGDGRDWYFGVRSNGKFALNNNDGGSTACKVSNSTLTTNTACILGASLDYSASTTPTLYLGSTIETTTNDDASAGWGTGDGEIGRGYTSSSYYFKGEIFEILIYDSVLSLKNREKVFNYLKNKWDIQ